MKTFTNQQQTSVNSKRSLSSTFPSHGSFFKQFHQSRPSWNSSEIELHGSHKQIFRNFFYRGIQSIQSALLLAIYPTAFPKQLKLAYYHSTLVKYLQFINRTVVGKKNVVQTWKLGLQLTMLIHFGEVFEVFGMFWERFFFDQLPVGCNFMALPETQEPSCRGNPDHSLLLLLRWSTDQRCTGAVQKKRPSNSCGEEASWFTCELSKKQKFQGQTDGHLNKMHKSLGGQRIPKMD